MHDPSKLNLGLIQLTAKISINLIIPRVFEQFGKTAIVLRLNFGALKGIYESNPFPPPLVASIFPSLRWTSTTLNS